jgi:hypothetical protein
MGAFAWSADMTIQLTTNDGSTNMVIKNASGADVASIDSLGNASYAALTGDGGGLFNVPISALVGSLSLGSLGAGALPANVIASSVAVGSITDSAIVGMASSKITGLIPNASIDSSSITKLGNITNAANGLVRLDGSNRLPALDASLLSNIPTSALSGTLSLAVLSAGSLPSNVIASSIAAGSVTDNAIVGVTASKLTGLIPNASIDPSSITKLGNVFNAANGLAKLDSSGNLNLPSGSAIFVGSQRGSFLPTGTIILTTWTCPSGFSEFLGAGGYYLAGVPPGGTVGGTVGTAMTNLSNAVHSHTISTVSDLLSLGVPLVSMISSVAGTTGDVARGTIAPLFQIRLCVVP